GRWRGAPRTAARPEAPYQDTLRLHARGAQPAGTRPPFGATPRCRVGCRRDRRLPAYGLLVHGAAPREHECAPRRPRLASDLLPAPHPPRASDVPRILQGPWRPQAL